MVLRELEYFNPETQTASEWLERLDLFFELELCESQKEQVNTFLHYVGPKVYTVIHQACLPAVPKTKTMDELKTLLMQHYEPQTLNRSYRRKLALRVQEESESVAQYANALRVLISKCGYAGDHLETVLVDTFTRGVKSEALKAKFDKARDTEIATLQKCIEMAQVFESLEEAKQSRTVDTVAKASSWDRGRFQRGRGFSSRGSGGRGAFRGGFFNSSGGARGGGTPSRGASSASSAPRGASRGGSSQRGGFQERPVTCFACGEMGHKYYSCRFSTYTCNMCNEYGHIRKACPVSQVKAVHEDLSEGVDNGFVEDFSHLDTGESVFISKLVHSVEERKDRFEHCVNVNFGYVDECDSDVHEMALKMCQEIEVCNDVLGPSEGSNAVQPCQLNWNVVKLVQNGGFGESLVVKVLVNGKDIVMEVDNGSKHSLITKARFIKMMPGVPYRSTSVRVASLSGHSLRAVGESEVVVTDRGRDFHLRFVICDGNEDFIPLLGREWLDAIVPGWREMLGFDQVGENSLVKVVLEEREWVQRELNELKVKYPHVFSTDGSTSIKGFKATVVLRAGARPVFHKEYSVPYSERERVTNELRMKVQQGRYVKVDRSEWASPVWPVPKPHSDEIRVVHDYKRTVNPNIVIDHYPLPLPVDIFNDMVDCSVYCVLDCADAFMQIELDETSQDVLVLNTCIGLLKPTRLPYGLASASACFQSVIDQVLHGLDKIRAYIDDIIIGGKTVGDCRKNLHAALKRLDDHRVRIKFDKIRLYHNEVEILGYVLGHNKYYPSPSNVKAIVDCPTPQFVQELHSYVGMLNFYAKFLPHGSTVFKSLYALLGKNVQWSWTPECDQAFKISKQMLLESKALAVYDPSKTLIVVADASPVGIGAVLAIRIDNVEYPVEFMSKMLTLTQQRYSQLEREGLAIVVALQKFHKYLWGRHFILVTDNMPLKTMFSPDKATPKVAAQRLQRWSVFLGNYDYQIEYRKSANMGAADMLSRLPLKEYVSDEVCNLVIDIPVLPISVETIALETNQDAQLSVVRDLIVTGWPETCPGADLKVYFDVRYALSVEDECIMLGDTVVVPASLQKRVLANLHDGHPGIVRMKLRARSLMWWPTITKDVEEFVAHCQACSQANFKPVSNAQVSWEPTTHPWERIHIDFYFLAQVPYLLCVDSFSKWVEVWEMAKTNAPAVIDKLSRAFATWGLPVEIVSDNGPPFNSFEFLDFCTNNLIVASKSALHHPEGNGQGEKFVGTVKHGLDKGLKKIDDVPKSVKLSNYLLQLRTTPSTVTMRSPCSLMLKFEPKTLVSALKPKLRKYVPSVKKLQVGDVVKVKLSKKHEIFMGKIAKIIGPTLVLVERITDKKICQVSINQIQIVSSDAVGVEKADPLEGEEASLPSQVSCQNLGATAVSQVVPNSHVSGGNISVNLENGEIPAQAEVPSVAATPRRSVSSSPATVVTPRVLRPRSQLQKPRKLASGDFVLN